MSRFDLSSVADFSRITQQSLGDLNVLLDGKDPSQWDILEGSYNGVIFHVFQSKVDWQGAVDQITDSGGRRKAKYKFPYKDGQTTDDLGRRPGSFQMGILLHGIRYMKGYQALLREFDKPTPGVLIHPIRGQVTVVIDDITVIHKSDQRKAVLIQVTFDEHNFSIGDLRELKDNSVKGKLAQALDIFKKIDAANRKIEQFALFARGVKNRIQALLNLFKQDNGVVLTAMNVTFNLGVGSTDIPALLPVNQGGTRLPDGTLADDNFVVVRSISDPFNSVPIEALTTDTLQALAVVQIQKQIVDLRLQAAAIIEEFRANDAELDFFDEIIDIRESCVMIQDVFEAGIASSNARIIDYTTPRVMSAREVAFANLIPVNRVQEIDLLNPELLSTNYIEQGTILKVPVA